MKTHIKLFNPQYQSLVPFCQILQTSFQTLRCLKNDSKKSWGGYHQLAYFMILIAFRVIFVLQSRHDQSEILALIFCYYD